ncbi:MAG: hypothetical protein ABFD08_18755 [Syntrophomonas sp.]
MLGLIVLINLFGCNTNSKKVTEESSNKMTEEEYINFVNQEYKAYKILGDKLRDGNQAVYNSYKTNGTYADPSIVKSYSAMLADAEKYVSSVIESRKKINPPDLFKENNQLYIKENETGLANIQKEEDLISSSGYDKIGKTEASKLSILGMGHGPFLAPMKDYIDKMEVYKNSMKK